MSLLEHIVDKISNHLKREVKDNFCQICHNVYKERLVLMVFNIVPTDLIRVSQLVFCRQNVRPAYHQNSSQHVLT